VTRPFRFACQAYRPTSGKEWRDLARRVEDLGYSTLHVPDHVVGPGPLSEASGHRVQTVAAIPAMAVAAAVTTTLRVGSRLLCVAYHHPVVLAKEAATLDMLSDGRLEFGLGAGWLSDEYEAMGIGFDSPAARIDRLSETLDLIEQCFSGEQVDLNGEYIQAHGFRAIPAVVQSPRPPLMIGGGGKRILTLAGERADIVSVNFNNRGGVLGPDSIATSTSAETHRKLDWVRQGAGDRFEDVELEIAAYFVAIDGTGGAVQRLTEQLKLPAEELQSFPHALIGSVDEICDELQRRREEYGFSYITVGDAVAEEFAPVVKQLAGQ
jgi:probable F420-dependent oxidoreductase